MAGIFGHQPQNTEEASDDEVVRRTHMQAQGSFKGHTSLSHFFRSL